MPNTTTATGNEETEDLTDQNNIRLIYNRNVHNTIGLRIKAFFNQIFRGKKDSNSEIKLMVKAELEDLNTDYEFKELSESKKYNMAFANFRSIELENGKDISSLADITKLGNALTSDSEKDRRKENGFYRLISEPLHQLNQMEKDSEEYTNKRDELLGNIKTYLDSHNPYSKVGKARCEFAVRLDFLLNEEKELEEELEEELDESEERDEELESNISDEREDEIVNVNRRERISFNALVESRNVGLSNRVRRSASMPEMVL